LKPFTTFESEGFNLHLAASDLNSLLPHEDVIEAEVKQLSERISKERMQRDPIIVDLSSKTILDGMHRYHSLKRLDAKSCIVCYVNYYDDRIKVGRWIRAFNAGPKICEDIASLLGMKSFSDPRLALQKVDEGSIQAALVSRKDAFVSLIDGGKEYPKKIVKRFDDEVYSRHLAVYLLPDDAVDKLLDSFECIFYPRTPKKEEIINSAKLKELFPAKSTRHEIPYRPVGVDFPLEMLFLKDVEEINSALSKILEKRKARILEPGTVFHGRKYKETLVSYEGDV